MHPTDSSDFDTAPASERRRKPGRPKKQPAPAKPVQPTVGYQKDLENLRRVQESRPMKPPGKTVR